MDKKTVFEIDGNNSDYDSDSDTGSDSGSDSGSEKPRHIGGAGEDSGDEYEMYDSDEDVEEQDEYDEDEKYIGKDKTNNFNIMGDENEDSEEEEEDDDENEDEDENYLQKITEKMKNNIITEHHPELVVHNFEEVDALCTIVRNEDGIIIDPLHRTLPFITKYEKAKILGERAKQLNAGAEAFVDLGDEIVDGYLIALAEFEQKKIPMIIRRPLPNNGSEYWRLSDLEIL